MANRDKIIIRGLVFYGHHGVSSPERELGQRFSLDLEMRLDLKKAGESDDLADTIDYQKVYRAIREYEESSRYHLIEALAEGVAKVVLERFPIEEVLVRAYKPCPPIGGLVDYVACEITRSRE